VSFTIVISGWATAAEPVYGPGSGLFQRAGSVAVKPVTPAAAARWQCRVADA